MPDQSKVGRFEEIALPHLRAAYNLARWLVHNEHEAEDIVQEAYLRAFKFFSGYYGGAELQQFVQLLQEQNQAQLR